MFFFCLKPVFYAAELLRAFTAEDPPVEDEFVDAIAHVIKTICGGLPEWASRERIRRVCSYLGKPGYGERWWQIHLKLNDLPLSFHRPPGFMITIMKLLFAIYCTTAEHILRTTDLWHPRKTLLSFPYAFRQFMRLIDYWLNTQFHAEYSYRFPLLKTRDKIILTDARWAILCEKVNHSRSRYTDPETPETPFEHRKWPHMPLMRVANVIVS